MRDTIAMSRLFLVCTVVVSFTTSSAMAGTWTTIPVSPRGISGTIVVGTVWTPSEGAGAGFYDIATQTKTRLDYPGGTNTVITGIDGNNMVGYYLDSAQQNRQFLYNGTDWETLALPASPSDIDGDNIVGSNYIYNMATQSITTPAFPGATSTYVMDMDGESMVGAYVGAAGHYHGFLYDGTTWTDMDPGLAGIAPTILYGISGNHAVGIGTDTSNNNHGFLYDLTDLSWTALDYPGATETSPSGIDGNYVVGDYAVGTFGYGFLYTIPEPSALSLLALGGLLLMRRRLRLRGVHDGNR